MVHHATTAPSPPIYAWEARRQRRLSKIRSSPGCVNIITFAFVNIFKYYHNNYERIRCYCGPRTEKKKHAQVE